MPIRPADTPRRSAVPAAIAHASIKAAGVAAALVAFALPPLAIPLAGAPLPVDRAASPEAEGDPSLVGTWRGTLEVPPGARIPLVFHVSQDDAGSLAGTMDSPAQGVMGIPLSRVLWDAEAAELTLELAAIGASFRGTRTDPDTFEGEWRQGGLVFPLLLTRSDAGADEPGLRRPQHPEPPFPYRVAEVRFPNASAGIELAGTLTLPDPVIHGDGPYPGVVLITGSGPQDRDETILGHKPFLVLADHLTRNGIAVLRHDDRGVGASGGDFATATSVDFAGDAASALDYLAAHPAVAPARLGLIGHSEGGLIAPMVATGNPGGLPPGVVQGRTIPRRDLAFVVLLAGPGLPGGEILLLQAEAIARASGSSEAQVASILRFQERMQRAIREEEDPDVRRARLEAVLRTSLDEMDPADLRAQGIPEGAEEAWIEGQLAAISSDWFRIFVLHDPRPALRELRIPVLALFGELDLQVPPEENLEAMEGALDQAGNPDATVVVLPGLNHLFQTATTGSPAEYGAIEETFAPAALEILSRWIVERFVTDPG